MDNATQAQPVTIICAECGEGVYLAEPFSLPCWECTECGHRVASHDIDLEAGESLTTDDTGALAYIPADDDLSFLDDAEVTWGDADDVKRGYEMARKSHGDDYADYLVERDREHNDKGLALKPWPLSLQGNDGD